MEIADFIPNYPQLSDDDFNDKLYHKKEFYDLKTDHSQQKDKLWNHQILLSRFLSPYTDNKRCLLYHAPGTGKTCVATAVAEINFKYPFVKKPILIIVPNDTLANQWKMQIALTCTSGQYIPENYFSEDPATKLTTLEKNIRMTKLLKPNYFITTMEKMRRYIDKKKVDEILRKKFSNTIIIIDEVHNLRIQTQSGTKKKKDSESRYNTFKRFLNLVENTKVLLLSGTPIYDSRTELGGLLELLLEPGNKIKITKEDFIVKDEIIQLRKRAKETLRSKLTGKISYIKEGGNFPIRKDISNTSILKYIKLYELKGTEQHAEGYLEAFKKDTSREKTFGLWKNSRQAVVFMYKDGTEYKWGQPAFNLLVKKLKALTLKFEGKTITYTPMLIKDEYSVDLKENLKAYSPIFNFVIQETIKSKYPLYVFTPLVTGTGGAIFLSLLLKLYGYRRAVGNEKTELDRYAIITGEEKSNVQRRKLLEIYNSEKNRDGSLIKIIIGTKTMAEGTNLLNARKVFILSPYWNNSAVEQAIARAFRATALLHVPIKERSIEVYHLLTTFSSVESEKNINIKLYKMSEKKDVEIKFIERILKEIAWDCPLNYERNVDKKGANKSRKCDYQICEYKCTNVEPLALKNIDIDKNTFFLYYSDEEINETIKKLKDFFRDNPKLDVEQHKKTLGDKLPIFLMAIERMIKDNIVLTDRYGRKCFLRKYKNMLYLLNDISDSNIEGYWYFHNPYVSVIRPLDSIIMDENFKMFTSHLGDCSDETLTALFKTTEPSIKAFIVESFLRTQEDKEKNIKILKHFKNNIYDVKGQIFHNILHEKMAQQSYVDYKTGALRQLENGVWIDAKPEDETIYKKREKKPEYANILKKNLYGILSQDKKFKIVDKTKETARAKTDKRTIYRGKNCIQGWDKWQLIELFIRLNIKIETTDIKSKEILLGEIKRKKFEKAIPRNVTIPQLQTIYTLSTLDVKKMCNILLKWFSDNKILIKE